MQTYFLYVQSASKQTKLPREAALENNVVVEFYQQSTQKADVTGQPQGFFPVSSLPQCEKGLRVRNKRLLPRAKVLLVPMNVFSGG